ncbi:MAG: hypothetical protein Kow0069_14690 [Promethearchaeota archaeon]
MAYVKNADPDDCSSDARLLVECRDTTAKGFLLCGFLLVVAGLAVEALAYLPVLVGYDVLFFSESFQFTLATAPFWRVVGVVVAAFGSFVVAFAFWYRLRAPGKRTLLVSRVVAASLLGFVPVGTFFGAFALVESNRARELVARNSSTKPEGAGRGRSRDLGLLVLWSGLFHLTLVVAAYLLTTYLSTLMLDVTYPFLTMRTISRFRVVLAVAAAAFSCQVAFGAARARRSQKEGGEVLTSKEKPLAYFFGLIQLPVFPVGTYLGATLLRELCYDRQRR